MFSLPAFPLLTPGALPISPGLFMIAMVLSACAGGVVVVFNYLSLKARSTHRLAVVSVMLLIAGLLIAEASIATTFDPEAPPLLHSIPGMLAIGVLLVAASIAFVAFLHCYWHRHRYRRGRKRALGSFVGSLLIIGGFFGLAKMANTPTVHVSKSKVELLPETDAYGRPLGSRKPGSATPAPAPVPVESSSLPIGIATPAPVPIATPKPENLLQRLLDN